MINAEFNKIVDNQLQTCRDILTIKRADYDGDEDDRFNAFKRAANLQNCTVKEALAGMMAKHTTSIYDMCESDESYAKEKWIEKITDHINYLLLLRAIIEEETNDATCK